MTVESGNMRRFQSLLHENMKIKLKINQTMKKNIILLEYFKNRRNRHKIDAPNTHMHDSYLSCIGTGNMFNKISF